MKIKMHALYDHFPDLNPVGDEPHINCYSDMHIFDCKTPDRKNFAMLLEPRSMIGDAYRYALEHANYFSYIFTHDSELLRLPNARMFNWADVWLTTDSEKTKDISLMTSYKNWCPLHNARLEMANYFKNWPEVDVFYGDWNNPQIPTIEAKDYLEHYKFSIIIENDIDEFWYTEKILNCFATKTVPIYIGATKIHELFNPDGIIQRSDYQFLPMQVAELLPHLDEEYEKRREAIEDNFRRIEPWKTPWKKRFFAHYGKLLEELQNE